MQSQCHIKALYGDNPYSKSQTISFCIKKSIKNMAVGIYRMPWLLTNMRRAFAWHAGRGDGYSKREWHLFRRIQNGYVIKNDFCASVGSLSKDEEAEQPRQEVQEMLHDSEFVTLGVDVRLAVGYAIDSHHI